MAIDADLNAGILDAEQATQKREEIAKEADFYGAMDGASKFVKGDAVAGILILAINIIGGLIIGITQHDLAVGEAAETYILLSIGDGLVAQIPSLLLAIATAIGVGMHWCQYIAIMWSIHFRKNRNLIIVSEKLQSNVIAT